MRAIIPCAGFGSRMGMAPDQAKELLHDHTGYPMIDWTFKLCEEYGIHPFVITRTEKETFREYLRKRKISYACLDHGGEWPRSIYESKEHWDDQNILLLPDTRFTNRSAIEDIRRQMNLGSSMVLGTHQVLDPQNWGIVERYHVWEKSKKVTSLTAWGVIAFENTVFSESFFMQLEVAKVARLRDASFVNLSNFKDITRTGKIT